jgi:tripartite-type tricarboxylate transporter receptor subunit TctC
MKIRKIIILGLSLLLLITGFMTGCSQPAPAPEETPAEEVPAEETAAVEPVVNYPERPISLIVGFNPGGPTDVIARGIIPILQEKIAMGIGIANMPGASSSVAATHVLDQRPDGYTLFYGSEIMSIWQTMGTVDLSPVEDFIPVKLTSQAIPVLAVPPDSPFETVKRFLITQT